MDFVKRIRTRLKRLAIEKKRKNSEIYKEYQDMHDRMQESIAGKIEKHAASTAKLFDEHFE